MAYTYGSATSPSDLLDQIRAFLVLQSWTVDSFVTEAPGKRLHMHKDSHYFNAKSADTAAGLFYANYATSTQIAFSVGTGYTAANAWYDQPGVPRNSVNGIGSLMALPSGAIIDFHMFYDDTYKQLIVWVQRSASIWRWMSFGESFVKAGAWTGGQWCAASGNWYYGGWNNPAGGNNELQTQPMIPFSYGNNWPVGYLRADVDSFTGQWIAIGPDDRGFKNGSSNVSSNYGPPNAIPWMNGLASHGANKLNGLNCLFPLKIYAARDASPGGYSLLGTIPNVFLADITGLAVGAAYNLGGNQYYPFPSVNTHGTVIQKV